MAIKIQFVRAETLEALEIALTDFFTGYAEDVRTDVDLVGGITFANGEFIAPVRVSAPHKRRFDDEDE